MGCILIDRQSGRLLRNITDQVMYTQGVHQAHLTDHDIIQQDMKRIRHHRWLIKPGSQNDNAATTTSELSFAIEPASMIFIAQVTSVDARNGKSNSCLKK